MGERMEDWGTEGFDVGSYVMLCWRAVCAGWDLGHLGHVSFHRWLAHISRSWSSEASFCSSVGRHILIIYFELWGRRVNRVCIEIRRQLSGVGSPSVSPGNQTRVSCTFTHWVICPDTLLLNLSNLCGLCERCTNWRTMQSSVHIWRPSAALGACQSARRLFTA